MVPRDTNLVPHGTNSVPRDTNLAPYGTKLVPYRYLYSHYFLSYRVMSMLLRSSNIRSRLIAIIFARNIPIPILKRYHIQVWFSLLNQRRNNVFNAIYVGDLVSDFIITGDILQSCHCGITMLPALL